MSDSTSAPPSRSRAAPPAPRVARLHDTQRALLSSLDGAYAAGLSTLARSSLFPPLVALARNAVLGLLSNLAVGQLHIVDTDGTQHTFGDASLAPPSNDSKQREAAQPGAPPRARLDVRSDAFWLRMAIGADLGFAEAYMGAEVDTPDLGACFSVFIHNREALGNLHTGPVARISSWIQGVLNKRYANTRVGSLQNIGAHYDISNAMYEAFLSADMTYSCAVFPTLDADVPGPLFASLTAAAKAQSLADGSEVHINGAASGRAPALTYRGPGDDVHDEAPRHSSGDSAASSAGTGVLSPSLTLRPEDELEAAQLTKLRLHVQRANIRRGDRVLEIGTGWGSFAMEAVRSTGCTVDSLTLSVEQKALAEARIAAAGLSASITVHLLDYRDMPAAWTGAFDRIVSIEMLEAVGLEFLSTYFAALDRVLSPAGTVCVQCITMPESRFEAYASQQDFIRKWIFPGGVLPSVTALWTAARDGSAGRLVPDGLISIGPHYARTLREWRARFETEFDARIAPALVLDHPEIRSVGKQRREKELDVFRRKWRYYFEYCEIGFTERVIGDHILTFTREGNVSLPVCCG